MGSVSQHHVTKSWEVRFKSNAFKALVGGARTLNFPPHAEAEARAAEQRIEDQIARAEMPPEFQGERGTRGGDRTSTAAVTAGNPAMLTRLFTIVNEYEQARRVSASDRKLYSLLIAETENPRLCDMTLAWAEELVKGFKNPDRTTKEASGKNICLAPSSIRKRIGALTRACDWYQTKMQIERPISFTSALGRGYSQYIDGSKTDESRERLYQQGEEAKVLEVLNGDLDDKTKADLAEPAFKALYLTIRNTGMRLREAYTLRVGQIDWKRGEINVNGSKGHYGAAKPRTVPMLQIVEDTLREAIKGKRQSDLVFPFWDGHQEKHPKVSAYLSQAFSRLFKAAGVEKMREHDLRHVATVQWVTAKLEDGHYAFSESEILQMMGWSTRSMLDRYIKGYRADDLGDRAKKLILIAA